jgi:hypothetical protein
VTTPYCDECKHYNPRFYELDVSACHKGHKPRYYIPQTHRQEMNMDYGHKKAKCPDREPSVKGEKT